MPACRCRPPQRDSMPARIVGAMPNSTPATLRYRGGYGPERREDAPIFIPLTGPLKLPK